MDRRRVGPVSLYSCLFLMLIQTSAAVAQNVAQADPPQRRVTVWTNPVLLLFSWYTIEAEIRLADRSTVGVSGSFVEEDDGFSGDDQYLSVNVFYRYYTDASFKGFFFGGQLGTVHTKDWTGFSESDGQAFSAGVLVGYGWLLGDPQRIGVSLGIGANRLFGGNLDVDGRVTLPVIRLINVGAAF